MHCIRSHSKIKKRHKKINIHMHSLLIEKKIYSHTTTVTCIYVWKATYKALNTKQSINRFVCFFSWLKLTLYLPLKPGINYNIVSKVHFFHYVEVPIQFSVWFIFLYWYYMNINIRKYKSYRFEFIMYMYHVNSPLFV